MTAALTEGSEDYDPTKALALVEVMIIVDFNGDDFRDEGDGILGGDNKGHCILGDENKGSLYFR